MASSFKGVVEKFKVTMVDNDSGSTDRVTIQLSLDGLKVLNQDASRTLRSYNLRNVSRWDLMNTSTVIWTKTDVDLEERPLTLSSDPTTIRNVVDTLATCCLQLAEIIKDKESDQQTASNLEELAAGGGKTRKAAKLPSVDSVDYWRHPDKSGWLQSQSEVMKMWRKRWFVLKQGYLFRFLGTDVSESVKPRGVVDLSKVQDVRDGRAVTGKANTIQLKTASGGSVCYVCESETEMVEWISALEGSIAKIVKLLAGVDDTPKESSREKHRSSRDKSSSSTSNATEWAKQMERSTSQSSKRSGSSNVNGSTMISVVDYAGGGGSSRYGGGGSSSSNAYGTGVYGGSSGAYGGSSGAYGGSSGNYSGSGYGSGTGGRASAPSYEDYGGISNYNQISGIAGVASAMDDLSLNYGGYAAPAAAAARGPSSSSYGTSYGAQPANNYGSSQPNGYGNTAAYGSGADAYGSAGYGAGSSGYQQDGGSSGYGYGGGSSSSYQDPAAAAAAAGGGYGYQQQQQQPVDGGYYQQQQQQPAGVSLIDQVPSQQPAYPYYQQMSQAPAAAVEPAAAPAGGGGPGIGWQVHYTAEGRPYYHNPATGTTQWEAPAGM